jgi:DNA-binding transcriptional LysR family regulator
MMTTEAGRNFYEHAVRAIEEANEAYVAAAGASGALSGQLRVCSAVAFARLHIIPYLADFLAEHPALEIDLLMDDRNVDLVGERVDLALRLGPSGASPSTAYKIGECRRLGLGAPSYFQRLGEPRAPSDLIGRQAIILDQPGHTGGWTFRQGATEISIAVDGRLHVTTGEGVRAAVLAELGFTVASEWLFAPELQNGGVRQALLGWTLPSMDLWAVFPAGRLANAKARAFAAFVEARMRAPMTAGNSLHS